MSGGQTGVDRAALDFALKHKISCGGWCPKNRKAEDGRIHDKYPLIETVDEAYLTRTIMNIEESDGTLILYKAKMDAGTILVKCHAENIPKPFLEIKLFEDQDQNIIDMKNWLIDNSLFVINIAGPRESNNPGVYKETIHFLESFMR